MASSANPHQERTMNITKIPTTFVAVAAALLLGLTGVASAASVDRGSSSPAAATSTPVSKKATAGKWGTINTGNQELDDFCEGEADFVNQPAMQTPAGGNTMKDLKELNTDIVNQANQKGCHLFPA
jgi:hypothetical protein